jgi:hypothetical protein
VLPLFFLPLLQFHHHHLIPRIAAKFQAVDGKAARQVPVAGTYHQVHLLTVPGFRCGGGALVPQPMLAWFSPSCSLDFHGKDTVIFFEKACFPAS